MQKKSHFLIYLAEILIVVSLVLVGRVISHDGGVTAMSAPDPSVDFETFSESFRFIYISGSFRLFLFSTYAIMFLKGGEYIG